MVHFTEKSTIAHSPSHCSYKAPEPSQGTQTQPKKEKMKPNAFYIAKRPSQHPRCKAVTSGVTPAQLGCVCAPGALCHGKVLTCPSLELQFQKNSHQWVLITAMQAHTCHFKLERQQLSVFGITLQLLSCTGFFMHEHSTHTRPEALLHALPRKFSPL